MNIFKAVFRTQKQDCIHLYDEAKKKKPGKAEKEYLKLILLTKPPFDYQIDIVLERILKDFKSIDKLADFIDKIPVDDDMWKSRARNIKIYKKQIEHRNMLFFKEFWLE
ncbi:MAG: hypothetical protein A2Y03_06595 [Omnitrophica WOR_2 bacterium GWF2_38_59]|nr:MAG: hypothetical protein A2Y03_06595 [Omnitrophica WOR_2 bacterium GWF2_38_59]OGX50481.1 MAG: hypothetical protein A2243_01980 [Omnitrophica WOR_2 bacterium RIFOXYA2_FULL_38_17]OGX59490.1 MAG: hypothetical protein A2306_09605 [Omnitrophica WOR_2 bacterium RIFOXYB2_FULL_38_16]HBG62044.1 hypothetical protein [Candidatus Omnitrophota bacterium]